MSVAKTKNLAIVLLVIINIFFLTFIIIDNIADARSERLALENACAALRAGGIEIDQENIKTGSGISTMRTVRADEAEELIARAVLGSVDMTDLGVIYLYENPSRGTAEFASAGDFEILLNKGVVTGVNNKLREIQKILRDMKLETSSVELTGDLEHEVYSVVCAYKGLNIFNCMIEFIWDGDDLKVIKGRYVTGSEPAENGVELSSVSTAMLGFLAAVRDETREDIEGAHIYGIEPGYRHRVIGAFGEGEIEPVWLITTDTGRFIIDSTTGEIQSFG